MTMRDGEQISRFLEQINIHVPKVGSLRCHLQSIYVNVTEWIAGQMDRGKSLCNLPGFQGRIWSLDGRLGFYVVSYTLQDGNFFPPKRRKRRTILQVTNSRRPLFKKYTFNIDTTGIDLALLQ
jgi:hypothetical protein